jgi:hypothetical protein
VNFKELWTITQRLVPSQMERWRGRRVLVRCDNTVAVSYLNRRTGPRPRLLRLLQGLEDAERDYHFAIVAIHIRGVHNWVADRASRDLSFASLWNSDPTRDLRLKDSVFQQIVSRLGHSFGVDAWADRAGLQARAPVWGSPAQSAFTLDLSNQIVYAFPPQCAIRAWLDHVPTTGARVIVTITFANPRALPAHALKRLEPRFKRLCVWGKGARCLVAPSGENPLTHPSRGTVQKAPFEVWALMWPKSFTGPSSPTST